MYDHYPSLRGCVRDCCRRFIERWRKSASYRSESAEEKSGKKHLLSLSLSSFLFFSLSTYLPLSFSFNICFLFFIVHIYISRVRTSHFSYESCIFVSIAPIDSKLSTRFYDDGCVFMNIRYFFFIFSLLPYLLLISSICIPRSVFVFSSSFFFLSSFPSLRRPFSLSFSISICLCLFVFLCHFSRWIASTYLRASRGTFSYARAKRTTVRKPLSKF